MDLRILIIIYLMNLFGIIVRKVAGYEYKEIKKGLVILKNLLLILIIVTSLLEFIQSKNLVFLIFSLILVTTYYFFSYGFIIYPILFLTKEYMMLFIILISIISFLEFTLLKKIKKIKMVLFLNLSLATVYAFIF